MQLRGSEIKSLRNGRVDISESYAREEKNEIFLINSHFAKYSNSSYLNHEEVRPRKLLLKKKELIKSYNIKIEYLELRNMNNFNLSNKFKNSKIFIAFYLNKIRLIDNI